MLNLALDLQEMALLSALAQEPPTKASPLRRICAAALQRPWSEVLERSLPGFVERGLVTLDDQGRPRLGAELGAALHTLHAPEQTLSFGRQASLVVSETVACRRGDAWTLLALARDADLVVMTWPLERAPFESWFAHEFLGGLALGDGPFAELSADLALGELLILLGLQAVYRRRAAAAAPLRGAELWVSAPELAALTPEEVLAPWEDQGLALGISGEMVCSYLASDEHRQGTAARLVERGILWATRNSWALSEEWRPLLDPGLLQDVLSVGAYDEVSQASLLHVLQDGCLLIEVSPASPLHVRLTGCAELPDAAAWFARWVAPAEAPAEAPVEEPAEVPAEAPEPEPEEALAAPVCSRCGAELQPGQRFCGNCGAPTGAAEPTPEAPVCPECGVLVPAHARFCPECGAPLAAASH